MSSLMPERCIILVLLCTSLLAAYAQQPNAGQQIEVDLYGNVFVLDGDGNTLRLLDRDGKPAKEIGGPGWGSSQFDRPSGFWARNGIDVYVADYGNHRIQRFDRNLSFVSSLSTRDNADANQRFGYPTDVSLSRLGELYICDGENSRIVKVNSRSQVEKVFGGFDAGKGRLERPSRIEIGPKDYIYVLDGARVMVFDAFGNFVHELVPGVFKKPGCLAGDRNGVLVFDSDIFYFFDEEDRAMEMMPLSSVLLEEETIIHSLALARGTLYMLTNKGVVTVPDPRTSVQKLDK
jgi:hypothetical protein